MNRPPFVKGYQEDMEDESFFLMTILVQGLTGLPSIIMISPKMNNGEPWVRVQGDYSKKLNKRLLFTVTLSEEHEITGDTGILSGKDIATIKKFV